MLAEHDYQRAIDERQAQAAGIDLPATRASLAALLGVNADVLADVLRADKAKALEAWEWLLSRRGQGGN